LLGEAGGDGAKRGGGEGVEGEEQGGFHGFGLWLGLVGLCSGIILIYIYEGKRGGKAWRGSFKAF
jgi:hypothetical protein